MKPDKELPTLSQAFSKFLDQIRLSRSQNTARTYGNALSLFSDVLRSNNVDPEHALTLALSEEAIGWFADRLKDDAPTTERLYLTAAARFYEYLAAEELAEINLPRVRLIIQQRARRPGQRLPQFPRNAIDEVIEYAKKITEKPCEDVSERLRALRDKAFLITLADTGLRVHEACKLRRGDIDWNESRAMIIGKGNKQAIVRFSRRSLAALKEYLKARQPLDGNSGKQMSALPLFARHDPGAGSKIKPITTTTGRNIVSERVREALGDDAVGTITPHSFRHYFVTMVLKGSGNLKLAQELARHSSISVTQRYAHLSDDELDRGYFETIDRE